MLNQFFLCLSLCLFFGHLSLSSGEPPQKPSSLSPEFRHTLSRGVLAAHKKGHKYHSEDREPTDLKETIQKVEEIRSQLSGQTATLVLGVHPYEPHPLIEDKQKNIFFLNETVPSVPKSRHSKHESHFFHLNFNSEEFKRDFASAAHGIFSSIYFDWSTFKFANKDCLEGLYSLLPMGGQFIVPEPITMIFEVRKEGESQDYFWSLPKEEQYKRNLEAKVEMVRKAGFTVKMLKSTDLMDDPTFRLIAKHVHAQEDKEKAFNVLIATKKPPVPPKPQQKN